MRASTIISANRKLTVLFIFIFEIHLKTKISSSSINTSLLYNINKLCSKCLFFSIKSLEI